MTPATVHWGMDDQVTVQRQQVLDAAYAANPERFVKGIPTPPQAPDAVWINPPLTADPVTTAETGAHTEAISALTGDLSGAQVASKVGGPCPSPTCAALDATCAPEHNCLSLGLPEPTNIARVN